MSETSIEPRSIAAVHETAADPKMRTFRVLKYNDRYADSTGRESWDEVGELATVYVPQADDIGPEYGEGDYLLIEMHSRHGFSYVYPTRIVADRVYRLADDDEVPA